MDVLVAAVQQHTALQVRSDCCDFELRASAKLRFALLTPDCLRLNAVQERPAYELPAKWQAGVLPASASWARGVHADDLTPGSKA